MEDKKLVPIRKYDRWFNKEFETMCIIKHIYEEAKVVTLVAIVNDPHVWPYNLQDINVTYDELGAGFIYHPTEHL